MYDVPSLVAEPLLLSPLRRAVEEGVPPVFVRSAKVKLTARCNLRCVMCKYGRGWAPPELPGARFAEVMDELAALGCRKVHFSGGEVLARPDFEVIAGRAAAAGMKVTLTSNLTLLTRARAKALMRHKISSVSTSLDGATAKVHERVRGIPGAFAKTLRGMGYLARERARRGQRTRLRVNFVMMRQNFRDHPALVRLAAAHGATELHPMPVDTRDPRLRLSKRLIRLYNEEIAPEVRAARAEVGFSTAAPFVYPFGQDRLHVVESAAGNYAGGYYAEHLCYAPYTHMFVGWDGAVSLCCMTNGRIEPLGDLGRQSVAEVFQGPAFQAIRRQMEAARLPTCHACDMYLGENQALHAALARPSPQEPTQAPSSSVA
jgi:MoaA/NifB/PqqE/SkfB family radical SAM enzyme